MAISGGLCVQMVVTSLAVFMVNLFAVTTLRVGESQNWAIETETFTRLAPTTMDVPLCPIQRQRPLAANHQKYVSLSAVCEIGRWHTMMDDAFRTSTDGGVTDLRGHSASASKMSNMTV